MKRLVISLSLFFSVNAAGMTSKTKQISWSLGGCGTGLAVGAVLSSSADDSDKAATLATNFAIGCGLGILGGWLFVEDDQTALQKEVDKLSFELNEAQKLIRRENYQRLGSKDELRSVVIGSSLPKDFDFEGFREKGCYVASFRLMDNGKSFVPVSENIIMPNIYYYLVSKDKERCVLPDQRFGILNDIITGIGSALHNAADDAAQDQINRK